MLPTTARLRNSSQGAEPVGAALGRLKDQARQQQLGRVLCRAKLEQLGDAPTSFAFEDLRAFWVGSIPLTGSEDVQDTCATLWAILRILKDGELEPSDTDQEICQDLVHSILRFSVPIGLIRRKADSAPDEDLSTYDQLYRASLKRCGATSELGLEAIYRLIQLHYNFARPPLSGWLDENAQITLLALSPVDRDKAGLSFSDNASIYALELFAWHHDLSTAEGREWIIDHVLKGYLRRLFGKSKPSNLSSSGRPAMFQNEEGDGLPDDSPETKPWKYDDLRSTGVLVRLLEWADDKFLADNYMHLLPPLAALAEDSSATLRVLGLKLLGEFLLGLPANVVRNRGLAPVFVDIIFPSLSYLPTLTPEGDSVMILGSAFQALVELYASVRQSGVGVNELLRLSDKIFRQGMLSAYNHAGKYLSITTVLMKYTTALLNELGISAVKYLKDLLPMLLTILTNPLLIHQSDTLLASLDALSATIQTCHVRILATDVWTDSVIEILSSVYLNTCDSITRDDRQEPAHADDQEKRRQQMDRDQEQQIWSTNAQLQGKICEITESLLQYASDRNIDLIGRVRPLCEKEPKLQGLFKLTDTPETTSEY